MARTVIADMSQEGAVRRYRETKLQTLSGSNTTVATPLFKVTGSVRITKIFGVVQTALGSNVTAAYLRANDQTAQVAISLATGVTLSSFAVGSLISRKSLVSVALSGDNASAGKVVDPVAATAPDVFMPFCVVQKTGGVETDIEFVYTTTNTPTSGVIKWYCEFEPLTEDGDVRAV